MLTIVHVLIRLDFTNSAIYLSLVSFIFVSFQNFETVSSCLRKKSL